MILTPSITISPRPWRELYPAEIDGKPTRTYFHWLALAYAVTLAGHPAVSLPVGLDRHGMPFGLQIVGPRGGDAFVLAVAAALEALLAGDARTARPVPDIARLQVGAADQRDGGFSRLRLNYGCGGRRRMAVRITPTATAIMPPSLIVRSRRSNSISAFTSVLGVDMSLLTATTSPFVANSAPVSASASASDAPAAADAAKPASSRRRAKFSVSNGTAFMAQPYGSTGKAVHQR